MKLLGYLFFILFPSFAFATFPLIPVNQSPADNASDISKTPLLTGSTLAFDSGGGTLVQSEWLVYEDNGTQVIGGRVTSTGEFISDASVQYQTVNFDGSFSVAGEAVATMDIDANGTIVLRNAANAQLLTVDYDFDTTAKPQSGNAYVLVKKLSDSYSVHFLQKSDANSWSKTLEVVVLTTGANLVALRISDPLLSDTFFDNTFGDIGFTTHVGTMPGSDLGTFSAWKTALMGTAPPETEFALGCTVQANGSCNTTSISEASLNSLPLPTVQTFTGVGAVTYDFSSGVSTLDADTNYNYQVRYLANNGVSDLYSNWSIASDFTTLLDVVPNLTTPSVSGAVADEEQNFNVVVSNAGSDAGDVEVQVVWPFDVIAAGNFSSAAFSQRVNGVSCGSLSVSGGKTTQNCTVAALNAGASETIAVQMEFPASAQDQVYALEYRACKVSCATNSTAFDTVNISVANSGDSSSNNTNTTTSSSSGGGAAQLAFWALLLGVFLFRGLAIRKA